jgi:two-component system response regulator HupR/HoxA
MVEVSDLPEAIRLKIAAANHALGVAATSPPPVNFASLTLAESKELAEMQRIKEALAKHKNNRLRAAGELGISRMGLYKKLHKYGMVKPQRVEAKETA